MSNKSPYVQICDTCSSPIKPGEAFHNCDGTLTCPACEADELEALEEFHDRIHGQDENEDEN